MKETEKMINMMVGAYIEVMGLEKWNSLTEKERHDAVMILVEDSLKALDKIGG